MTEAIPSAQNALLARGLKSAWLSYWVAFFGNFVAWRVLGSEVILIGFFLVAALTLWLAWATARAASFSGHKGLLWAVGVVVILGPVGALLLPWAALSNVRSAK
jgi:hypothetical protein